MTLALDWTQDAEGRSNSSPEYRAIVDEVARLIRADGSGVFDERWVQSLARLIVSQLAHKHGMTPTVPVGGH